jgi:hypothetical protein
MKNQWKYSMLLEENFVYLIGLLYSGHGLVGEREGQLPVNLHTKSG